MTENEFNEMLLENRDYLKPFSFSLTRNSEDADDLIQDTMYRALVNKEKYKTGTNIKAWLYTIMRNIFINNYRRRKKFTKVSSAVPEDFFLFQTDKVAKNDGVMNFGLREIKTAMDKLPDVLRLSFEMHYIGYKYLEISQILKEPLGTIKSRIHFARKMLSSQITRN